MSPKLQTLLRTTWLYKPEYSTVCNHHCGNLISNVTLRCLQLRSMWLRMYFFFVRMPWMRQSRNKELSLRILSRNLALRCPNKNEFQEEVMTLTFQQNPRGVSSVAFTLQFCASESMLFSLIKYGIKVHITSIQNFVKNGWFWFQNTHTYSMSSHGPSYCRQHFDAWRTEVHYVFLGGSYILFDGFQASPARPSGTSSMKVKTLE